MPRAMPATGTVPDAVSAGVGVPGRRAPTGSPLAASILAHHLAIATSLVVLLCAYHFGAMADFGFARIGGQIYALVDDDVMISMRYGRNLASGAGLVYNAGERVEGFSNPLMTFVTAALHLLPVSPGMLPAGIMLLNVAFSVYILLAILRFGGDTADGRLAGFLAAAFYALLPHHAWYSHAGYEVYMQMAILVFALSRLERMRASEGLVLGFLPLTHATALLMWALLVPASVLLSERPRRQALAAAAAATVPFAAYEVFRMFYYGETLPNTYWLKAGAGSLLGGARYAAGWLLAIAPLVPLAAYAVLRRRTAKRSLILCLVAAHTASIVMLGGDLLPQYRFLFPCSVLLALLAGAGGADWLVHGGARGPDERSTAARPAVRYALVAGLLAAAGITAVHTYRRDAPAYETQRRWNIRHIATGIALRQNTAPAEVVALFGLGFTGYFGDRPTIDMLGKADYHIARLEPRRERPIGHNKTDISYVLARNPAYVELNLSAARFADVAWLRQKQQTDDYGMTYDLALDAGFRERYAPSITDRAGRRVGFYTRAERPPAVWSVPEEFYVNMEPWLE